MGRPRLSYKFDGFHGRALYELNGLPEQVRNGPLLQRLLDLLEEPWNAVAERPGQSAVRQTFFGDDGQGMLTFIVDDETGSLRVIDILWPGWLLTEFGFLGGERAAICTVRGSTTS
ncbi:hypothetical protein NE236_12455 [Actinoallomurus purpureus]|uniref:hypothetical protein n=1 Tax=Actinoallomurus purpureus TaxID=478114 RepID=UPI002093F9D7|nr:hypothetical protein [Actinoallomurus purpureus]MCO6005796.1 hypothetical protein [Actinoallomurus purpureus]